MKTSSAKAKGRKLCRLVADKILARFPLLHPDDVKITSSGATGEDLSLSPLARQKFPFSIECKNQEKINIWASLEQAEKNANGHTPLLIFSRNRSKTYCVLEIDDFMSLFTDDLQP